MEHQLVSCSGTTQPNHPNRHAFLFKDLRGRGTTLAPAGLCQEAAEASGEVFRFFEMLKGTALDVDCFVERHSECSDRNDYKELAFLLLSPTRWSSGGGL